jgi:hypothetical protein
MVGDSTTLHIKKRLVVSTSTRGGRCTDENMSSVKNCRFSCDYTRENCGVICIVMQYTYVQYYTLVTLSGDQYLITWSRCTECRDSKLQSLHTSRGFSIVYSLSQAFGGGKFYFLSVVVASH